MQHKDTQIDCKEIKSSPKDKNPQHSDTGRLQGDDRMTTKHWEIIADAQNYYYDTQSDSNKMINIHQITTKRREI